MITPTEICVLAIIGVAGLAYIIGYERGRGVEHQRWYRGFERLSPEAAKDFMSGLAYDEAPENPLED